MSNDHRVNREYRGKKGLGNLDHGLFNERKKRRSDDQAEYTDYAKFGELVRQTGVFRFWIGPYPVPVEIIKHCDREGQDAGQNHWETNQD